MGPFRHGCVVTIHSIMEASSDTAIQRLPEQILSARWPGSPPQNGQQPRLSGYRPVSEGQRTQPADLKDLSYPLRMMLLGPTAAAMALLIVNDRSLGGIRTRHSPRNGAGSLVDSLVFAEVLVRHLDALHFKLWYVLDCHRVRRSRGLRLPVNESHESWCRKLTIYGTQRRAAWRGRRS